MIHELRYGLIIVKTDPTVLARLTPVYMVYTCTYTDKIISLIKLNHFP